MRNSCAYSVALGAVMAFSNNLMAQNPPAEGAPPDANLRAPANDDQHALKEEAEKLRGEVTALKAELDKLRQDFADLQGAHAVLENRVHENTDNIEALSSVQDGRRVPNLLGNMNQSMAFRDEVMRTIQGQLIVTNHFSTPRVFFINGSRWTIQPGVNTPISVPLGRVTAHLERESPKSFAHWQPEPKAQRFFQMSLGIGPNRNPSGL